MGVGHLRSNYHFNFLSSKLFCFGLTAWRKQIQLKWLTALLVHCIIGIVSSLWGRQLTDYSIVRKINKRTQIQLEWLTALPVHSIIYIVSILRERKITDYFIVRKINKRTQIQLEWFTALPVHSIIYIVSILR